MSGFLERPIGRRRLTVLVAAAFAGVSSYAALAKAATDPGEVYVSGIADQVMQLANSGETGNSLRQKFANLLNRYINFRQIANYALGTYKVPAARQDEFYGLVNFYAAALFAYYVEDFRGSSLDIMSNTKQGSFTVIQSAIMLKSGGREQVRWRLAQAGGGYRVSDVNVKGVWLTIAMKDRFTKVLTRSRGDFGPLFDELRQAQTW